MRFANWRAPARIKPAELFTYTYSTSVRAAMLAAGFYVAKGCGTGPKAETTIGLSPRAAAATAWPRVVGTGMAGEVGAQRGAGSLGSTEKDDSWREAILAHPQFSR